MVLIGHCNIRVKSSAIKKLRGRARRRSQPSSHSQGDGGCERGWGDSPAPLTGGTGSPFVWGVGGGWVWARIVLCEGVCGDLHSLLLLFSMGIPRDFSLKIWPPQSAISVVTISMVVNSAPLVPVVPSLFSSQSFRFSPQFEKYLGMAPSGSDQPKLSFLRPH